MALSNQNRSGDDEDWVLVSDDLTSHPENSPQAQTEPLFRFNFEFKLGCHHSSCDAHDHAQNSIPGWPPSTIIPQESPEQSRVAVEQEQSPLFMLPLEIRLHIYTLVLRPRIPDQYGIRMRESSPNFRMATVLTFLLTCRRVLREAEHIFYATNRLWVYDLGLMFDYLGPSRLSAVSTLAVPAQSAGATLETLKRLQVLPNLRSLHLVRQTSVKFIGVPSWSLLAPLLIAEIRKLTRIEDLKIITPEAVDLTVLEVPGGEKLESIDRRL